MRIRSGEARRVPLAGGEPAAEGLWEVLAELVVLGPRDALSESAHDRLHRARRLGAPREPLSREGAHERLEVRVLEGVVVAGEGHGAKIITLHRHGSAREVARPPSRGVAGTQNGAISRRRGPG